MKIKCYLVALILFYLFLACSSQAEDITWTELKGPFGGTIEKIFMAPNEDLYAISGITVYLSTDKGVNWTQIFKSENRQNVLGITTDKNGFIYILVYQTGIYRKKDYNSKFALIYPCDKSNYPQSITTDNKGSIVAGMLWKGFIISTDSGDNWSVTNNGVDSLVTFRTVAINNHGTIIGGSYRKGIFFSTDKGATWNKNNDTTFKSLGVNYITSDDNGYFYAATDNGVFISKDEGLNWTDISGNMWQRNTNWIVIGKNKHLFAATNSALFISTDEGQTWNRPNTTFDVAYLSTIAIDNSGILYGASRNNGLVETTDEGVTWKQINNGFNNLKINAILECDGSIFVAPDNLGLFQSTDKGQTWKIVIERMSFISLFRSSNGTILASSSGAGIFFSKDTGKTWGNFYASAFRSASDFAEDGNGTLFSTANGFSVSTDNGATWAKPDTNKKPFRTITRLFYIKNTLYASTQDTGVVYSSDCGHNWQHLNSSLPKFSTKNFLGTSKGDLYVSIDSMGLFKYSKEKKTWENVFVNFKIVKICKDKAENIILATERDGIVMSSEVSSYWKYLQKNPPFMNTMFISRDNYIYFASDGIISRSNEPTGISELLNPPVTLSSYPEPADDVLYIDYKNQVNDKLKICIFNIMGERVKEMDYINNASDIITIDIQNLLPGVYYFVINNGEKQETGKFLISR